jgi:hypothetical protein
MLIMCMGLIDGHKAGLIAMRQGRAYGPAGLWAPECMGLTTDGQKSVWAHWANYGLPG